MEKRPLGRTGHMSSVVIFGGAALYREISQEDANRTLDLFESYGVNHLDLAPSYGFCELRTGPWLESRRSRYFVGCKTLMRDYHSAWAELHRSLSLLRTDHLDLHQLHAVTSFDELDVALALDGAIKALTRARDEGLTRWLGITGHGINVPAVFLNALERFDFDTVMFPIHPRLYADASYRRDAEKLLQVCMDRGVGVMIIKAITRGPWGAGERDYHTWYQPFDQQDRITQGVRFALSLPGVTAIPAVGETRLVPMLLDAARDFQPMTAAEREALIEQSAALEPLFA